MFLRCFVVKNGENDRFYFFYILYNIRRMNKNLDIQMYMVYNITSKMCL